MPRPTLPSILGGWLRGSLCATILALATAGTARAEGAPGDAAAAAVTAANPALAAERQKVRADLDRINKQIDTLKREKRGLGDDYRLRGLMADAEALARKLNDIDARLGGRSRTGAASDAAALAGGAQPAKPFEAPQAKPSDDRSDLEAKADILTDQARRLNNQANTLAGRVATLRGRQELRRRAGQLERDPFAPLERPARLRVGAGVAAKDIPGTTGGPRAADVPGAGSGPGPQTGGGPTSSPPTGPTGAGTPSLAGSATTSIVSDSAAGVTPTASSHSEATPPPSAGATIVNGSSFDSPGSVAAQFRGVLDSSTLAEIRRLESPGSPAASLQAMERALSALHARAAELDAGAAALRVRARSSR